MITAVLQQHKNGCGIAALAMVCGQTYEDVLKWFIDHGRTANFEETGMSYNDIFVYLNARHYCYQKRFQFGLCNVPESPWPPPPFAEAHIWSVPSPSGTHFLVVDALGKMFDPLTGPIKGPDYYQPPGYIIGVWKTL